MLELQIAQCCLWLHESKFVLPVQCSVWTTFRTFREDPPSKRCWLHLQRYETQLATNRCTTGKSNERSVHSKFKSISRTRTNPGIPATTIWSIYHKGPCFKTYNLQTISEENWEKIRHLKHMSPVFETCSTSMEL